MEDITGMAWNSTFDDPVGGNPDDWIYVTGTPFDPINVGQVSVIPDSALHYDLPEFEDPDDLTLNDVLCAMEAEEAMTDYLATLISNEIASQTDHADREYGAVIYCDTDGNLRRGDLVPGETYAEAQNGIPKTHIKVPDDLGPRGIVAVVHNHPLSTTNQNLNLENRYPSYNGPNDPSDYLNFQSLVGQDARFGSAFSFSFYIRGPDGVLREYDWRDGQLSLANDPDPDSRDDIFEPPECPIDGGDA